MFLSVVSNCTHYTFASNATHVFASNANSVDSVSDIPNNPSHVKQLSFEETAMNYSIHLGSFAPKRPLKGWDCTRGFGPESMR